MSDHRLRRVPLPSRRLLAWAAAAALTLGLAGCGGGDDDGGGIGTLPPATCSVADQNAWLGRYMTDWYFWTDIAPRPNPGAFTTTAALFDASLFQGGIGGFPRDRWSYYQSTESFNRFWGEGQTLGYGLAVAGLEVRGQPFSPLYVRHVEPLSPAGSAGIRRGDQVLSINGRPASEVISADDFSALSSDAVGQSLNLVLRRAGVPDRSVTLASAIHALTPVPLDRVIITPGSRRLGYLVVKDMISQTAAPLEAAFARFRAAGVQAVVLDLRYNGGGLVSVGGNVASYIAGARGSGQVFTQLLYNSRQAAAQNSTFRFGNPASALGAPRVYVLTGQRTCSASEQLINGLRGIGLEVVSVGDTTCGKPVGFLPSSQCGTTYSVVNFESVNARNEGRYFDGFAASCPVSEDFRRPLGEPGEPLLDAAIQHADTGVCGAFASGADTDRAVRLSAPRPPRPAGRFFEGDAGPAMLPR